MNTLPDKRTFARCGSNLESQTFVFYLSTRMALYIFYLLFMKDKATETLNIVRIYQLLKRASQNSCKENEKCDLIAAIAKNMTAAELAKAAVNIQIQQMIHDTRIKKGWTQKDLADKMGVKQSLVSRWESGECNYTIDTLIEIADALGLSVQCPLKIDSQTVSTELESVKSDAANNSAYKMPDFSSNAIRFPKKQKDSTGGAA